MRAVVVTPAEPGSLTGNRVTAERWAQRIAELGHDVSIVTAWNGESADLLVALHARRSHASVVRFNERFPGVPVVVGLTGTDVYQELHDDQRALDSIHRARLLVALQRLTVNRLPPDLRDRVRVIHQSAEPPAERPPAAPEAFEVCVLAHLRAVKDPLLAARAVRRLPADSRVRVLHAGQSLDEDLGDQARREDSSNPRYRWLGPLTHAQAGRLLAASRLLVLCSASEGGANVVSEAIACGVPVLSTRIDGSVGLLGDDYPGFFGVGDESTLAELLRRAETDAAFLGELRGRCNALAPLFTPDAERDAWRSLLLELQVGHQWRNVS